MTIGTAGGRLKASSGYAFTRIQQDSAAIVQSLIETGQPFNVPADSSFFRLCDALLLHIMRERGATIQSIFAVMFRRNPVWPHLPLLGRIVIGGGYSADNRQHAAAPVCAGSVRVCQPEYSPRHEQHYR